MKDTNDPLKFINFLLDRLPLLLETDVTSGNSFTIKKLQNIFYKVTKLYHNENDQRISVTKLKQLAIDSIFSFNIYYDECFAHSEKEQLTNERLSFNSELIKMLKANYTKNIENLGKEQITSKSFDFLKIDLKLSQDIAHTLNFIFTAFFNKKNWQYNGIIDSPFIVIRKSGIYGNDEFEDITETDIEIDTNIEKDKQIEKENNDRDNSSDATEYLSEDELTVSDHSINDDDDNDDDDDDDDDDDNYSDISSEMTIDYDE